MNNFPLEQLSALKLVWAVNVQNYTILPATLCPAAPGTHARTPDVSAGSHDRAVVYHEAPHLVFPAAYPATRPGNGGAGGHHQTRPSAPAASLRGDDAARTRDALRADPTVSRACAARNHPDIRGIDDSHDQGELPKGLRTVREACPC